MRKLKLQMQVSIDGYSCGLNDKMDFMVWNWDDALHKYTLELHDPVDCIIMGRKLAEGFIPYWKAEAENPQSKELVANKINDAEKIVFTRTMDKHEWERTELAKGPLVEEVNQLKSKSGGDIIAYGGVNFVADLIQHDLIDEYYFYVNPAIIGEGRSVFNHLDKRMSLQLVEAIPFGCGITVLRYSKKS